MRQRRLDHLAPVVRLLGRPVSERRPEAEWHGRDSKSLQQAAKHFLVEHLPVAEREHERASASARASEPHPGCPEHAGKAGPVLAVRLHPRRRNGPHVGRRVHLVPWCTAYLGPPRHRQDQGTRTPASRPRPRSTPAPSRPLPPRADAAAPACDSRPRSACRAPGPSRSHGLAERRFIAMAHSITAPMHRADAPRRCAGAPHRAVWTFTGQIGVRTSSSSALVTSETARMPMRGKAWRSRDGRRDGPLYQPPSCAPHPGRFPEVVQRGRRVAASMLRHQFRVPPATRATGAGASRASIHAATWPHTALLPPRQRPPETRARGRHRGGSIRHAA